MAEILLTNHGAVADDSTDCTSAWNNALAALAAQGGGILRIPDGITRIAGKVFGSPFVPITIEGGSNSVVRFVNNLDRRMEIGAQGNNLNLNRLTFIGTTATDTGTNDYNATNQIFMLRGKFVALTDVKILGLAVSGGDVGQGVLCVNQSNAVFERCIFDGCAAPQGGVIRTYLANSLTFRNCNFVDWIQINNLEPGYWSKTPMGNVAWIRADSWHAEGATNYTRRIHIEECYFDEGTANGVIVDGADAATLVGSGCNFGTTTGYTFNNVRDVRISQSWCGYIPTTGENGRCGVRLNNVGFARLEGYKNGKANNGVNPSGVNYIDILGTTKRVILENCELGTHPTFPHSINNQAGALVEIDGVKMKNGVYQY